MGSWSTAGRADQSVSLLEGIRNEVGDKEKVLYARGANITDHQDLISYQNQYEQTVKVDARTPPAMIDEAVLTARQADVIIAAVGKAKGMAYESSSRCNISILERARRLLRALKATVKPLVVMLRLYNQKMQRVTKPGLFGDINAFLLQMLHPRLWRGCGITLILQRYAGPTTPYSVVYLCHQLRSHRQRRTAYRTGAPHSFAGKRR